MSTCLHSAQQSSECLTSVVFVLSLFVCDFANIFSLILEMVSHFSSWMSRPLLLLAHKFSGKLNSLWIQ